MPESRTEAAFYGKTGSGALKCGLCPQGCVIRDGEEGLCGSRVNGGGTLYAANYGRYTSMAVDPIEKKPLYHFYPGSDILSIGGKGCNLKCVFCQNHGISQGDPTTRSITPEQLAAEVSGCGPNNAGIAFTYNEPFIWYEFIRDTASLVREAGGKVVLVTNGFVNPGPLAELMPLIDAMNVDLKAFEDDFYKEFCKGRIDPVKDTIASAVSAGVHVEITLLVIQSLNDDLNVIENQAKWLGSLSKKIPFHLSRYFPNFKLDIPPTPFRVMADAYEVASKHLDYVYLGNVGDPEYLDTKCPECGTVQISRRGYRTSLTGLDGSRCSGCGAETDIVN